MEQGGGVPSARRRMGWFMGQDPFAVEVRVAVNRFGRGARPRGIREPTVGLTRG